MLSIYTDKMDLARQAIEASPNPFYIKNEHGKFVLVNPAFASIHGIGADELLDRGTCDFDYAYERDLEILRSGGTVTIEELYRLANGQKAWYTTTKTSFAHHDGKRYLLSLSTDITALKETAQLAEANAKARSNLITSISNEIRTPAAAIQQAARYMRKGFLTKEQEEHLSTIAAIADSLLAVPQGIQTVARMEAGETSLLAVPFSIAHILRDTARAVAHNAATQGVSVQLKELPDRFPEVEGDPFLLGHVLMHLMSMMLISARPAEITLTAQVTERLENSVKIEFSAQSTGVGKTEEGVDTPLEEEHDGQAQLYGDIRTGLALCQHLTELQGGEFRKESAFGRIRGFHFNIPYPISHHTTLLPEEELAVAPGLLKGLNLLLLVDTRLSELLLLSQLQACGVNTEVAVDGEHAQAQLHIKAYNLILMDIQLPAPGGKGATSLIRSRPNPNRHTPVIAITPYGQQPGAEEISTYGITDHLLKPYHESKLYRLIARHTGRLKETRDKGALPHASQNGTVLYDFSGLGELKDDALFIRKMQQMFLQSVPEQLNEIKEAVGQYELAKVARIAHKLKSTYGNLGMKEAAEAMKEIERHAHGGHIPEKAADLLRKATELTSLVEAVFAEQLRADS